MGGSRSCFRFEFGYYRRWNVLKTEINNKGI